MDEQDQNYDPVTALQDLRERLYRQDEVAPEEYEKVLTALRAHRRAGARAATKERKTTGAKKSSVEKFSEEQLDEALSNF